MKKLILMLLLGASAAVCQVPNPPIPLTGAIGAGGVFPLFNGGNLIFSSDANHTMSYPEMTAFFLKVTSSVSLTATRNLIAPTGNYTFVVENLTSGGQSIQVIGASGTGVTIPNGSTFTIQGDGTNYVSAGGGGGGGLNQLTGDVLAGPGTGSQVATLATVNGAPGSYGDSTHTLSATVSPKGLITSLSNVAIPTASPGANGLGSPDNSTIQVSGGVYTVKPTTINGTTCTPGSSCTVSAGGTTATYVSAATCMSGVAFATGLAEYDNNAPTLGCYNSAASTAAYLAFAFAPASSQFAEASSGLPAFWTGTGLTILFTSTATSGNVIWEVQTACPALSGSTVGSPTFGTASTVTIAVPGTPGVQAVANISSIAANSVNGCPGASNTTPTQLIYRIFRSASDTANGDARLVAVIRTDSRSQ